MRAACGHPRGTHQHLPDMGQRHLPRLRLARITVTSAVAAAALLIGCPAMAQTVGRTFGQATPDLRGGQPAAPRDVTVDPRAPAPVPSPFQTPQPTPLGGGPITLPSADPGAEQAAQGGATARRQPSRASRPVRARVSGAAQRPVRAPRAAVSSLPEAPNGPAPRSTRIVTPAPDGLQVFPSRRAPRREDDPWAPLGLRLGTFVVTPAITQSLGYDTNPNRAPNGARGSAVSRTEGEVAVRSDWTRHSFNATLRGGYSAFSQQRDANRPDAQGDARLRLNVGADTDVDLDVRASLDTQRPGSVNFNVPTRERPNIYGYGAGIGATQRFNRLTLTLRGGVDRTTYDNAKDVAGNLIRQSDRDVTTYGLRGRVGYEVTPGFQPFVEAVVDTRRFDERVDAAGFNRASTGYGARVGAAVELTRLITGEASIGVQQRQFADSRLKDLRGVVGEAALIWTPTPLTTVTLRAATDLGDTTLPGVSGSINRRAGIEVAHALRRNWTVSGIANLSRSEFGGGGPTEDTIQLGLRTEYKLTRTTAVRASFTHERLQSTTPGADYTANIVLVGLRLQL
jgi:hypothetical protein